MQVSLIKMNLNAFLAAIRRHHTTDFTRICPYMTMNAAKVGEIQITARA